jgi:MOSC domain-containing protein YiiM
MHIHSVNIGRARRIEQARSANLTGIYKQPVAGAVHIGPEGLHEDAVCDTKHHGGPDQAVYVYGLPDYDWWAAELGRPLEPGTFGENLTVAGLVSAELSIGDVLRLPDVTLQVTSARIPCGTLSARMGDPTFARRFRAAERPGVYCRVLREGQVSAGQPVELEPYARPTVTVAVMFRDFYDRAWDEERLRRYLAAPIAIRDRVEREKELAALLANRMA